MTSLNGVLYILDCHSLEFLAFTQNAQVYTALVNGLASGEIAVPTEVWQDFQRMYPDEARRLGGFVKVKIRQHRNYRGASAELAEKLNSGFQNPPWHDSNWTAAAVCHCEGMTLVTTLKKKNSFYSKILKTDVIAVDASGFP